MTQILTPEQIANPRTSYADLVDSHEALRAEKDATAEALRTKCDDCYENLTRFENDNRRHAEALADTLRSAGAFIRAVRQRRHGTPQGDGCVLCRADQRELDAIDAALAAFRQYREAGEGA